MNLSVALLLALFLDYCFGEPKRFHPLVQFGRMAGFLESRCLLAPKESIVKQKISGILAVFLAVFPVVLVIVILNQNALFQLLITPLLLYLCIGPNSLKQHTLAVYQSLIDNDINQAKKNLSLIVSRETQQMDSSAIRRATIESTLENGADAIFAPLFWFVLTGATGVVFYRLINTLDAMWGYKNDRYLHFGWAAAKLDDLLNWIPARLTALSYALLGRTRQALVCWQQQAPDCESPNAGPVISAGAGALNLRLGGTAVYHGQSKYKPILGAGLAPENSDIKRTNFLIMATLWLWVLIIIIGTSLG